VTFGVSVFLRSAIGTFMRSWSYLEAQGGTKLVSLSLQLTRHPMEFGLELAPAYWGRYAYAIEVGRALLDFGFTELDQKAISGSTVSANTRIARLVE
jgi:RimJ/RimL family protein N-acetyltransferase